MSEDKKNNKPEADGEKILPQASEISNSLKDVAIAGNYVGGSLTSNSYNITLSSDALLAAHHLQFIEKFSVNAAAHISRVAQIILAQSLPADEDFGLDNHKLISKFINMKCTETYRRHFNEHAAYFPVINQIRETDAIPGGSITINNIVGSIRNLYVQFLDKYSNGDLIHSAIYGSILRQGFSPEEEYATHTLIFYVVNECGIFNEKK